MQRESHKNLCLIIRRAKRFKLVFFLNIFLFVTPLALAKNPSKESFCKLWIAKVKAGKKIEKMDGYELYDYLKTLGVSAMHLNQMLDLSIDPAFLPKAVDSPESKALLLKLAKDIETSDDFGQFVSQLNRNEMAVRERYRWTGSMSDLATKEWKRLGEAGIHPKSRFDLFKEVFEYYPLPELSEAFQTVGPNLQSRYAGGVQKSDIPDNMVPALVELAIQKKQDIQQKVISLKTLETKKSAQIYTTLYDLLGPSNMARELGVAAPTALTWKHKRLGEPAHFDPMRQKLLDLGSRALSHLESGKARKAPGDFWLKINMVRPGEKSKRTLFAEENKKLQQELDQRDPDFDSVEGLILDWNEEFSSLDALSDFIGFNPMSIYRVVSQSDSAKDFYTISDELENVVLKKHLAEFKKTQQIKSLVPSDFASADEFYLALELSYPGGDVFWSGLEGREKSDLTAKEKKRIWPLVRLPKQKTEELIDRYQSMSPEQKTWVKANIDFAKKLGIKNIKTTQAQIENGFEQIKAKEIKAAQPSTLLKAFVKLSGEKFFAKEKIAKLLSRPQEDLDRLIDTWAANPEKIPSIDLIRLQGLVLHLGSL